MTNEQFGAPVAPEMNMPIPSDGAGAGTEAQDPSPSATEVAKDKAADVAGSGADAAQHVAGVAKQQAGQVTAEAGRQLKQMVGQAQSELTDQAQTQQQKLAGGLHSLADQLKSMANNSDQPGPATDLAQQAADRAHQGAQWLEGRNPGDVLNEVRSFARRRPGVFLAVALGAGVLAGRLARGLAADSDESTGGAPSSVAAGRPEADIGQRPAVGSGDLSAPYPAALTPPDEPGGVR